MKILVLGGDGYLGWPTAMYFSARGHEVAVADNMIKRFWEAEIGVEPLNPVPTLYTRVQRWKQVTGRDIRLFVGDIARNPRIVYRMFEEFLPDAVVHYADGRAFCIAASTRCAAATSERPASTAASALPPPVTICS